MSDAPVQVVHQEQASRFEAEVEGDLGLLEYRMMGDRMAITHTEVPKHLEGRGIGGALVRAAMDHARARGMQVAPYCPFARAWLERHPDYDDLVAAAE